MERFRGGLVSKAHGFWYHSTLGSRVIKKKKKKKVHCRVDMAQATVKTRCWPCFSRENIVRAVHCRASVAHVRQSSPDFGLGCQVRERESFQIVPSSLGSRHWCSHQFATQKRGKILSQRLTTPYRMVWTVGWRGGWKSPGVGGGKQRRGRERGGGLEREGGGTHVPLSADIGLIRHWSRALLV